MKIICFLVYAIGVIFAAIYGWIPGFIEMVRGALFEDYWRIFWGFATISAVSFVAGVIIALTQVSIIKAFLK